ncbi:MAG: peptidoglycan bridge formation glycyltransferase FemA/FemB family protein, partial [Chloroflexota bacterium]
TFVAQHPNGSLLQTTNWARLKNRFGWHSQRVWLRRDGRLVAGAQMLIRSAALGLIRVAYIPHGPLVDWHDEEQLSVLLNQIDHAIYDERAGLLKMEPLLWQSSMPRDDWRAICDRQGCLPDTDTIQPPRTVVVDLTASEEDILARMKQKTRYNIRLSARKGVTVRQGSAVDIPAFNQLMQLTGQRNTFGVHEPRYYEDALDLFSPDNVALWFAEYESQPLAAVMVFVNGDRAAYLYGASSNEERQRMPTYAVQWAAMRWAKDKGCATYDLWGVPDRDQEELEAQFRERNDGLWGVYRFKRGFGGQLRRTVGTADRVYNKLVYRLYQWRRSQ